ncbi:transmembrane 4 L6 family member 4-like [Corythoichthys intestinalis]|uniref:transmembrane 4 L6 family member 4-like n=1 Tax=Corythoichthys intestinalis TaxID=161448 RepID=UPI0025A555D4|nr:transmembrane 4 L6 family member 4-like [Corythoichthys intestinalis]XP_061791041.1 transmembrane 4 L6 family member 4-like [Nerophis lumbriciformis]
MCSGGFARCLGISLMPLVVGCVLCNILLFFPGGNVVDSENITKQVWYFGGILGSGVLVIFPALVFLCQKNNDCFGCCGRESCGRRFTMLSSILFAAVVGLLGAGYSVIISALAIKHGPKCEVKAGSATTGDATTASATTDNPTKWEYPFEDGAYVTDSTIWSKCTAPVGVVPWHLSLFSVLLVMGSIQLVLCAVPVIKGLLSALNVECCGRNGGSCFSSKRT